MTNPQNGGELVAAYVAMLFGPMGSVVLAGIVGLACLTTSVGLTSACADFSIPCGRVSVINSVQQRLRFYARLWLMLA